MQGPYGEHLLDAGDVCQNCFRQTRLEREQTQTSTEQPVSVELSPSTRHPLETTIEYAPHRLPAHSKGTFCECGVEGTYERLWNPTDIERERFKQLLKAAIQTLEAKGVTIRREEAVLYCLSHFEDHGDADRALANGIDAGIVAAAAGQDGSGDRMRADGGEPERDL
jgi:hypothetical protein